MTPGRGQGHFCWWPLIFNFYSIQVNIEALIPANFTLPLTFFLFHDYFSKILLEKSLIPVGVLIT